MNQRVPVRSIDTGAVGVGSGGVGVRLWPVTAWQANKAAARAPRVRAAAVDLFTVGSSSAGSQVGVRRAPILHREAIARESLPCWGWRWGCAPLRHGARIRCLRKEALLGSGSRPHGAGYAL